MPRSTSTSSANAPDSVAHNAPDAVPCAVELNDSAMAAATSEVYVGKLNADADAMIDTSSHSGEHTPRLEAGGTHHTTEDFGTGPLGTMKRLTNTIVPPGGHISNIFNMASGTLGIGIVSMPAGFHTTGIVLSAMLMVVCGLMTMYSFYLIGVTCQNSKFRSWESAARGLFFRGADYVVAVILFVTMFGTLISYSISVHDLLGPFVEGDSVNPFLRTGNGRRLLTATVWFFGMFTLCIPRRVASLRYFSVIGVTLIVYFVIAVVVKSCSHGLPHLHEMKLFATGIDGITGLSLFIFAFLGHGLCFKLFDEMRVPTATNLGKDGVGSVSLVSVLYFVIGFFGYADIGPTVDGSVFKYYSVNDDAMMMVAYIGILLKICVAYALTCQASRLPVYYIIGSNVDSSPLWLHLLITCCICVSSLILGLFIPDVTVVFNLLGSLCGATLSFLLPCYYVMYLGGWTTSRVGWWRVVMSYLNIIAGVVAIVFGTAVTVQGVITKYG